MGEELNENLGRADHVVSMTYLSCHQAAFPPLFVRVCVRAHVGASVHIPQRVCVIHAFLRLKERSRRVPRLSQSRGTSLLTYRTLGAETRRLTRCLFKKRWMSGRKEMRRFCGDQATANWMFVSGKLSA